MSTRKRYTFFLDDVIAKGLKSLKARDGISEAETVRRAIVEFLERKGVKTERKRAATRTRS